MIYQPCRLLTATEVARLLRVGPTNVHRGAATGRLVGVRTPGGRWRFRESDVQHLLDEDVYERRSTGLSDDEDDGESMVENRPHGSTATRWIGRS